MTYHVIRSQNPTSQDRDGYPLRRVTKNLPTPDYPHLEEQSLRDHFAPARFLQVGRPLAGLRDEKLADDEDGMTYDFCFYFTLLIMVY